MIPNNGTFTFATPTNRTTDNKLTMSLRIFLPYMTLLLLPFIVSVIYILIRREYNQKGYIYFDKIIIKKLESILNLNK